ncbi:hypothetical protein AX644_RS16335 [Acinetobacter baumannii]|uniref:hypothetical protein n=1 Tax=Acinetobacter baumannii TaxID=470 RepID=UPI000D135AC4|nr:hypothetical protein [Acinetobacter baumannii]EHU3119819.1 hypothetical protein [Acinetobacter baumannii]EJB8489880.1 hypothetical protein [Acinetobacter baumannii]MDC4761800.1 hypothetical protein [Acinetobacter baumannii]MDO7434414.1 hypothetical protein [Acinetobacter baumannii]MDW2811524.1 hypothetical protein [Acinetobacter baumannii]
MARLEINWGKSPNDKTGDSARIGAQKMNSNFLEIYSFLSGMASGDTLPIAIPISRGGTGATTASGARKALGLGAAATKEVGVKEGDIMTVGTCGFGTDLSPLVLNVDDKTLDSFKSGELSYLSFDDVSAITLATRESNSKGQLGLRGLKNGKADLVLRVPKDGKFTPWVSVFHGGNAIVTATGNIKYALNSARLRNDACITQNGTALVHQRTAVGTYTIQNCVLDRNQWVKELPIDEEGQPLFKAALTQSGTSLTVKVTKDGKAYDIPDGLWIDLHLI